MHRNFVLEFTHLRFSELVSDINTCVYHYYEHLLVFQYENVRSLSLLVTCIMSHILDSDLSHQKKKGFQ